MLKTINNLFKIIVLLLVIIILSLSYIIVNEFAYSTEVDTINHAYRSIDLPPPTWNATTRYFESHDNSTIYVGYIKFKDMEHSVLEIIEFKNASTIQSGSTYSYISENNEYSTVYSKTLLRRYHTFIFPDLETLLNLPQIVPSPANSRT